MEIKMLLEFDAQRLESAINSFYSSIGVSISILYEDYSVLGSKKLKNPYCQLIQENKRGLSRCMDSNCALLEKCRETGRAVIHVCHAGLVEMAVPITYGGDIVGYAMLGHVKSSDTEEIEELISDLPIDLKKAEELYGSLPVFERERIEGISDMAQMLVKFLMAERILKPREDRRIEEVRAFVNENVDKRLTAQDIARGTHLSKTTLYNVIKSHTGNTINEYISTIKMEKSKSMLLDSDMTVEEIASALGFSSAAYYCRVFKRLVGVSPSAFRKTERWGNGLL